MVIIVDRSLKLESEGGGDENSPSLEFFLLLIIFFFFKFTLFNIENRFRILIRFFSAELNLTYLKIIKNLSQKKSINKREGKVFWKTRAIHQTGKNLVIFPNGKERLKRCNRRVKKPEIILYFCHFIPTVTHFTALCIVFKEGYKRFYLSREFFF